MMIAIGQVSKQSIESQIQDMCINMVTVRPCSTVMGGARIDNVSVESLTEADVEALQKDSKYISVVSQLVYSGG